jgi:hypothetical protein
MAGMRARIRSILLERERKEAAVREAIERLISRGPPTGSGIPFEACSWHRYRYGFIVCPASKGRHTCSNHRCRMGADYRELQALGLRGNRSPLAPKGAKLPTGSPEWGAEPNQVERVLAEIDPDCGDGFRCLVRCAHRMLLELCVTPRNHSPAD